MKKLLTLLVAAMLLTGAMGVGNANAFSLTMGEYNFVMSGFSYSNLQTGELRGIVRVDSVTNEATNSIVYQYGQGGDFLSVSFQDLFVALPSNPDAVFSGGYYSGGTASMWNAVSDAGYLASIALGPLAPVFSGTALGVELIDMAFATNTFSPNRLYTLQTVVLSTLPDLAFQTLGYLDVIGGTKQSLYDSNTFIAGSDVRFTGDAQILIPNQLFAGEWQTFRNQNVAAQTNVVPEPGTMLLLGAGMIGFAFLGRKRCSN